MSNGLKHRDQLYVDVSLALTKVGAHCKLGEIFVELSAEGGEVLRVFPLQIALGSLAKDLYWDELGDWSEAKHATLLVGSPQVRVNG